MEWIILFRVMVRMDSSTWEVVEVEEGTIREIDVVDPNREVGVGKRG